MSDHPPRTCGLCGVLIAPPDHDTESPDEQAAAPTVPVVVVYLIEGTQLTAQAVVHRPLCETCAPVVAEARTKALAASKLIVPPVSPLPL